MFQLGDVLLTGDSLCWSRARQDLHAFRDACWFSWTEQARSLEALLDRPFATVLAGHGDRTTRPSAEMHARLRALIDRMRRPAAG